MTVTGTNRKGVPTVVKRQPVGSVHAYWSDDSGGDILMLTWMDKHKIVKLKNMHVHVRVLSVGDIHTQVMPFHKNYIYMLHAQYAYVHVPFPHKRGPMGGDQLSEGGRLSG